MQLVKVKDVNYKKLNLVKGLATMLKNDESLKDLTVSIGELGVDELIDDNFLAQFPILEWIVKAKRVFTSVSDHLFLAKTAALYVQILNGNKLSGNFFDEIVSNSKKKARFSESLLFLIDRADSIQKTSVLGTLTNDLLSGSIEEKIYKKLCYVVQASFIDDVLWFGSSYKSVSNCLSVERYEKFSRFDLCRISEGKVWVWNKEQQRKDQCYNVTNTRLGNCLVSAVCRSGVEVMRD